MGAIPTSDMPGHGKLHERVSNALDRCQESRSVDFKESASWKNLKLQIIRTSLAMGNLRDGGIIVIGVSERGEKWELSGILEDHLSTFDVDDVIDGINRYASPPIKIDLVTVEYRNSRIFLAIQVHEFADIPFVCKRNGPDNDKRLRAGDVFVRPAGKPRTTRIVSADEMQDLLELAAEKQARKIIERAHRIGLRAIDTSSEKFEEELEGL